MKQKCSFSLIIVILILSSSLCSFANDDKNNKYLAGAVPEMNGRAVITRNIAINDKLAPSQIYDLISNWADTAYAEQEGKKQSILLKDPEQNTIIVQGDDKLTFKSTPLSLDRADMEYRLTIAVTHGKCELTFSYLKYRYQDFKGYEKAENLITDKPAYNAKKNKLNRYYDKFRIFTIDQIDFITNDLKQYLGSVSNQNFSSQEIETLKNKNAIIPNEKTISVLASKPVANVVRSNIPTTVKQSTSEDSDDFAGYKRLNNKLSDNILKMISQSSLIVNSTIDGETQTQLAQWEGLGDLRGEAVSMISVIDNNKTGNTFTISFINMIHEDALNKMEQGDKTALDIIKNKAGNISYSEAWMIIECKKVFQQAEGSSNNKQALSIKWSSDENQAKSLIMGEIIQIWGR